MAEIMKSENGKCEKWKCENVKELFSSLSLPFPSFLPFPSQKTLHTGIHYTDIFASLRAKSQLPYIHYTDIFVLNSTTCAARYTTYILY